MADKETYMTMLAMIPTQTVREGEEVPTHMKATAAGFARKKRVYLAGPLFSEPERRWCQYILERLEVEAGVEVIWPWNAVEAKHAEWSILEPGPRQVAIAGICRAGIDACDILVALLDTIPSDDGTSWELGYLWGSHQGKGGHVPVFGLRTDTIRMYGDSDAPLNAMVGAHVFLFGKLCRDVDTLVDAVRQEAERKR